MNRFEIVRLCIRLFRCGVVAGVVATIVGIDTADASGIELLPLSPGFGKGGENPALYDNTMAIGVQGQITIGSIPKIGSPTSFGFEMPFHFSGSSEPPKQYLAIAAFYALPQTPSVSGELVVTPFCFVESKDGPPQKFLPAGERWRIRLDAGGHTQLSARVSLTKQSACLQNPACAQGSGASLPPSGMLPFECEFATGPSISATPPQSPGPTPTPPGSGSGHKHLLITRSDIANLGMSVPSFSSGELKGVYYSHAMRQGTKSNMTFAGMLYYEPPASSASDPYFVPGPAQSTFAHRLFVKHSLEFDGYDVKVYSPGRGMLGVCQGHPSTGLGCDYEMLVEESAISPDASVVSIIDANLLSNDLGNPLLVVDFATPPTCATWAIASLALGKPLHTFNGVDRRYALSRMLNPGDPVPDSLIDPEYYRKSPWLYRGFSRFQVQRTAYQRDHHVVYEAIHDVTRIGTTHYPCLWPVPESGQWKLKRLQLFPAEAHDDNGDVGLSAGGRVYQVMEGRVGPEAWPHEFLLAHCEDSRWACFDYIDIGDGRWAFLSGKHVAYVWAVINFDSVDLTWNAENDMVHSGLFNSFYTYENGQQVGDPDLQGDEWDFAIRWEDYEFSSGDVP